MQRGELSAQRDDFHLSAAAQRALAAELLHWLVRSGGFRAVRAALRLPPAEAVTLSLSLSLGLSLSLTLNLL